MVNIVHYYLNKPLSCFSAGERFGWSSFTFGVFLIAIGRAGVKESEMYHKKSIIILTRYYESLNTSNKGISL